MALMKLLQKRPRAWLKLVLVPMTIMATTSFGFSQDVITTIYTVRHAEKLDNSEDSPLAPKGIERAQDLAHVLLDAGLTSILVSNRLRTHETAAPIAKAAGITPQPHGSPEEIVAKILADHVGGNVLVVGHSGTVDNLAAGLGVDGVPELKLSQYDRIFLVLRIGAEAHLTTLRYGHPTD